MRIQNHLLACSLIIFLFSCKTTQIQHLADIQGRNHKVDQQVEANNSNLEDIIGPYRIQVEQEMNQLIGDMPITLNKSKPNSNLGNWFSDVLEQESKLIFDESEVDFAIQNYGGIRIPSLAKGPITKGDIFELMPFDNTLVLIHLDKETTKKLIDRMANYGGWPISKSLSYSISDSIATEIKINGKVFGEKKMYAVAMPDYIANGGDDCDFLIDSKQDNSGIFIRKVVISHLEKQNELGKDIIIDEQPRIKVN